MLIKTHPFPTVADLDEFAKWFSHELTAPSLVFLQGDLGAGKTTLVQRLLQAWGYRGLVKSPTYTLVESYSLPQFAVHHFDLYRLQDPEELDYLGLVDYLQSDAIVFVEWPDKGDGFLPKADWLLKLEDFVLTVERNEN